MSGISGMGGSHPIWQPNYNKPEIPSDLYSKFHFIEEHLAALLKSLPEHQTVELTSEQWHTMDDLLNSLASVTMPAPTYKEIAKLTSHLEGELYLVSSRFYLPRAELENLHTHFKELSDQFSPH